VTPDGINDELFPFVRMTVPKSLRGKSIRDVPLREKVGRSRLLLFGILPFDFDDITIAEVEPGQRFLERSRMLSIERWEHERTLTTMEQGCEVRDKIAFELRFPFSAIPGVEGFVAHVLQTLFRHRHRRLTRWFTSLATGAVQRNAGHHEGDSQAIAQ
jgi:hypothetical protein